MLHYISTGTTVYGVSSTSIRHFHHRGVAWLSVTLIERVNQQETDVKRDTELANSLRPKDVYLLM